MIGELLPDQPDLKNPGVLQAKNVTPYAQGYRPTRELVANSNALTGPCRGAELLESATGVIYNYAGDETSIYTRTSDDFIALNSNYTLGPNDRWEFDRWYDKVVAVNNINRVQYGDFNLALDDANTDAPIAKHIGTARNYVMVGNLTENAAGLADAAGVAWCALGDPTNWTTSDSGYQHLDGAGAVTKILGGEYFTICMEGGIFRGTAIGPPATFQFDLVLPNKSVPYSGGIVQVGAMVYFLSYDGFYVFNGSTAEPISSGKMSKTFFDDFDRDAAYLMTAEADLENNLIFFAYPGAGHSPDECNRAYCYNYVTGLWTGPIEQVTQQLIYSRTPGLSADDLDTPPDDYCDSSFYAGVLCDATQFKGGNDPVLGGFINTNQYAVPDGPIRTATIESGEFAHNEGGYSMVTGFRPLVDGTDPVIRGNICYRNETYNAVTGCSATPVIINPRTGSIDQRINARYHRYLIEVSGDFTSIHGGQPEVQDSGQR